MSFYWTMDEGGVLDKVDSTVGLVWPLVAGTSAAPGLFVNGTEISPAAFGQRGLSLGGTPAITINQATSTGISMWFWIKVLSYNTTFDFVPLILDDSGATTNRFRVNIGFVSALSGGVDLDHTNNTDPSATVSTPNLAWNLGDWHLIACTYDKTAHTLNIYIDGVLSVTGADPYVYVDLTNSNFTFNQTSHAAESFDFVIDEFGLSTKGALAQSQVTSLWNTGAGVTWPAVQGIVPFP